MSEVSTTQPDDGSRGIKKIKPPSAGFLTSSEQLPAVASAPHSASPSQAASAVPAPASAVGAPLEGPSYSGAPDSLFDVPAPVEPAKQPESAKPIETAAAATPSNSQPPAITPTPTPEPTHSVEPSTAQTSCVSEVSPGQNDKLLAEANELRSVINAVESLKFLTPRLEKSISEGVEPTTLVSMYRLATRSLIDELSGGKSGQDVLKREIETLKSKLSRKELELAAAEAANPVAKPSAGENMVDSSRVTALETELASVNEQREKLLVDIRNMRDRSIKDVELRVFREKEKFFRGFLGVLDAFDRATQQMQASQDANVLREGMTLIGKMIWEALQGEGLEVVDCSGSFDPRVHEAIGEVETDTKPDDNIFDELSRGYKVGERLIRPAMVRVARNYSGVVKAPPAPIEDAPPTEESSNSATSAVEENPATPTTPTQVAPEGETSQ